MNGREFRFGLGEMEAESSVKRRIDKGQEFPALRFGRVGFLFIIAFRRLSRSKVDGIALAIPMIAYVLISVNSTAAQRKRQRRCKLVCPTRPSKFWSREIRTCRPLSSESNSTIGRACKPPEVDHRSDLEACMSIREVGWFGLITIVEEFSTLS